MLPGVQQPVLQNMHTLISITPPALFMLPLPQRSMEHISYNTRVPHGAVLGRWHCWSPK